MLVLNIVHGPIGGAGLPGLILAGVGLVDGRPDRNGVGG
jgi:hypothetical protein